MKEIHINACSAGGRLDKLIFRYLDKASPGFVYKMIRKKNITLNGRKTDGSCILKEGDVVNLFLSDETVEKFRSEKSGACAVPAPELEIIYEDENICAACKGAGLLSQKASPSDVSANDFFLAHIGSDGLFKPGIQNRLDRNTSGIVISGKNPAAARELAAMIKERRVIKKYLCPAAGEVKEQILRSYLIKDEKKNRACVLGAPAAGAAEIITGIRPVCGNGRFTLVEAELITGKPHQIRAHLSYIHHPIAGDAKYGDNDINEYVRKEYNVNHQLLHAVSFEFAEAEGVLEYLNGTVLRAPLPDEFSGFLKGEGLWVPGDRGA